MFCISRWKGSFIPLILDIRRRIVRFSHLLHNHDVMAAQLGKSDSYSNCRPLYCLCTLSIPAVAFKCAGCLSASDACARLFWGVFFFFGSEMQIGSLGCNAQHNICSDRCSLDYLRTLNCICEYSRPLKTRKWPLSFVCLKTSVSLTTSCACEWGSCSD